jgi:hypothetical protein
MELQQTLGKCYGKNVILYTAESALCDQIIQDKQILLNKKNT